MEVLKPVEATGTTTEAGVVTETGAALLAAPVLPLPLPVSVPPAQDPTGLAVPLLLVVTSGPGSGNVTSEDSRVAQPLATFATKISGRAEKATFSEPEPAVMVTLAQFMYISRFPILLNHVQAKTAAPAGVSEGTVNV